MQIKTEALARDNISESVAIAVRNMVVDGRLSPDVRINEVHLSQQLGVSRTPLREALAKLAHEGALRAVPRFGYFVRALTREEFEQIYAIRPLLDPEALRLSGLPSRAKLTRLREINALIQKAHDADVVVALDDQFHRELLDGCPNKVLLELIGQFTQRTRRYEIALTRERVNISLMCAGHRSIIAKLSRGDLAGACDELRMNLETGREPIVEWLMGREAEQAKGHQ